MRWLGAGTANADALREHGLRVTGPRLAVRDAVGRVPHTDADQVLTDVDCATGSAARAGSACGWESDGELLRAAAEPHRDDDDFGQAGTLVRDVLEDAARDRLVETVTGHVGGVEAVDIRERALQCWSNVDVELGARVAAAARGTAPVPVV